MSEYIKGGIGISPYYNEQLIASRRLAMKTLRDEIFSVHVTEWNDEACSRVLEKLWNALDIPGKIMMLHHANKTPIPLRLICPSCSTLHIDEGEFAVKLHHTHACQHCGNVWRPAIVPTVGVRFLPGFKNEDSKCA